MINGIDVSVWQGQVNWQKVYASHYAFAGIKASEGNFLQDPQFNRNWQRSKMRGMRRIAYHFFHADISGRAQCEYFHNIVHSCGGFDSGDCAMLDIEVTNGVNTNTLIANAESFVTRFLDTTQCGIYIYTGEWFYDGILGAPHSTILGKCPLWVATYGSHPATISNWPSGAAIWQWTDTLQVPGIGGNVDGDRFLGTMKEYDLLAQYGGRK